MAYLEEITKYKKEVLKEIWNTQDIKSLISNSTLTHDQFKNYVMPFGKNPNTITQQGTYIMFEVDAKRSRDDQYMEYSITFWTIVSDGMNLTPEGVKVDLITTELDKLFCDSRRFGIGKLINRGAPTFTTTNGFSGRSLIYYTTDFRGQN